MRVGDHFSEEQKQKLNQQVNKKKRRRKKKKQENVNWHELMGTNRDTYKRVNGAVRRR